MCVFVSVRVRVSAMEGVSAASLAASLALAQVCLCVCVFVSVCVRVSAMEV